MNKWRIPIVITGYIEHYCDTREQAIYETNHDLSVIGQSHFTMDEVRVQITDTEIDEWNLPTGPADDFPDLDNFDGEGRRYGSGY